MVDVAQLKRTRYRLRLAVIVSAVVIILLLMAASALVSSVVTFSVVDIQWQRHDAIGEDHRQEAFYKGLFWVCSVQTRDIHECLLAVKKAYRVELIEADDEFDGWNWSFVKGEDEG